MLQYYFAGIISVSPPREGSRAGSGSVPLTKGSGSRRPKNMGILRIRIPNTVFNKGFFNFKSVSNVVR
jgi:hypothetical protein